MSEPRLSESVEPPPRYDRPDQVRSLLMWVAIVAGVVFIVAVVFFSGFFVGRSSSGYFGDNDDHDGAGRHGMMFPGQTGPYGPMGPGMMGPWGPGQQWPTPTSPTAPRP